MSTTQATYAVTATGYRSYALKDRSFLMAEVAMLGDGVWRVTATDSVTVRTRIQADDQGGWEQGFQSPALALQAVARFIGADLEDIDAMFVAITHGGLS